MRRCTCGQEHHEDDHRYIGPLAGGGGEVLLLANAPCCGTTYALAELRDAALCVACSEVVTGEAGDPKLVAWDEGEQASRVYCRECAPVPRVGRVAARQRSLPWG